MPRSEVPILDQQISDADKLDAVLAVFREKLTYRDEAYLDRMVGAYGGIARAMVWRDRSGLNSLLDHSAYFDFERMVFGVVSGLRINMRQPNRAFRNLGKWCGMTDASIDLAHAANEVEAQFDSLIAKYDEAHIHAIRDAVIDLLSQGFVNLESEKGSVKLIHQTNGTYFPVKGKGVQKGTVFYLAPNYCIALAKHHAAKAVHDAELFEAKRQQAFASARNTLQAKLGNHGQFSMFL